MVSLIHSIEKEGAYDKSQEMLLVLAAWKSILPWIQSIWTFSTWFEGKEGKIDDKTYKTKIAYKEEIIYKIDYRFVTKFMDIFCIVVSHLFIRLGRDDFGICFL